MKNKKILIFSTAYLPHTGGAEVAIEEIADRLPDYDFDMITSRLDNNWPKQEQIKNITVHRIGVGWSMIDKLLLAFWGYKKAIDLHKKNNYNLIWSVMASYNSFAALSFKEETGLPFLLTLQTGNPLEYMEKKTRFFKSRFQNIFRKADGLQAISTYLMDWGEKMGFSGEVKEIVPNGVDLDVFDIEVKEEKKREVRSNLGLEQKDFVLITASRLVEKNGIEYVVKALEKLDKEVKFVICGEGELHSKIKKITKDLNVEDQVLFQGNVDHERLVYILHASDVFIRPSLTEGLGNAFLEAMATGTPVIGTRAGGISDFLKDGETGFICEPENSDSIVKVINKIQDLEAKELNNIKENARELVRTEYNWDNIAKSMKKIFNNLCAS